MRKFLGKILLSLAFILTSQVGYSQTAAVGGAIGASGAVGGNVVSEIQNLIGGYGTKKQDTSTNGMMSPSFSLSFIQKYGEGQNTIMTGNLIAPFPVTTTANKNVPLTSTNIVHLAQVTSRGGEMSQKLNSECPTSSGFGGGVAVEGFECLPSDINSNNSAEFDFSSFINPLSYQDSGKAAKDYIQLVAGVQNPVSIKKTSDLKSYLGTVGSRTTALDYIFTVRGYLAGMTAGLNTLYSLYQERVPVPDLGTKSGLSQKDASPLQVEEFAAKRRLTNKEWSTKMEAASPITVEREMLYVLAEMRLELYKTRLVLERLGAMSAVSSLQQNAFTNTQKLEAMLRMMEEQQKEANKTS